jgi:hypothetical protein
VSGSQPSGGTQRPDAARDPDLPRRDDTVRDAQQQDDSTKATAGVTLPGGTKIEATSEGPSSDQRRPGDAPPAGAPGTVQGGLQVTIPFGGGADKPVDTSPRAVNPDAPANPGDCIGDDGRPYPEGWVLMDGMKEVARCVAGMWVPIAQSEPPQPGDYQVPDTGSDQAVAVAQADPVDGSGGWPDASGGGWTDPSPGDDAAAS